MPHILIYASKGLYQVVQVHYEALRMLLLGRVQMWFQTITAGFGNAVLGFKSKVQMVIACMQHSFYAPLPYYPKR